MKQLSAMAWGLLLVAIGSFAQTPQAPAAVLLIAHPGGQTAPAVGGGEDLPACQFYISTSGTGTAGAGGTVGDPWAISMLINATAQARYDGEVVCLNDGSYCMPSSHSDFESPYYNVAGGTVGDPTVIRATNARLAVIDGLVNCSGGTYSAQGLIGTTEQYVTFQNLTIKRACQKLLQIRASNVTVTGNHIHDLNNQRCGGGSGDNTDAIRAEGEPGARLTGIVISNNIFHDIVNTAGGWQTSSSNAVAVKLYDVEGTIFEYNLCYQVGDCFGEKINSAGSTARYNFCHTLRICIFNLGTDAHNTVWNGTPSSYTAEAHHNIAVNVEFFHETDVGFVGGTGFAQTTNIYNNTIYGQSQVSGSATYFTAFRTGGDSNVYNAWNNIWHLTTTSGGGITYENGAGNTVSIIDGNDTNYNWYPGTLRWNSGAYTTLANWRTACGCDAQGNTTSPGFANAGGTAPEDYVTSNLLTSGNDGGPVGAWDTGVTRIGPDWAL